MRIQRNTFETRQEALQAQQEARCAECGGWLKVGTVRGENVVLCVQDGNHRHIRPIPACPESQL